MMKVMTSQINVELVKAFEKKEVLTITNELSNNSCPGRHNISPSFFYFFWEAMGDYITRGC
jgi:hypothetical protein